jgi:Cytochrome C oxidase, cbb3-type, subunit III
VTAHTIVRTARIVAVAFAATLVLAVAHPAVAAGIDIAVGAPETVTVGQDVEVKAVLSQDGAPVEGAEVAVTYQASLGGDTGRVELASATTDETGTAVMIFQQRADDNGEMQIVYLGPDTEPVNPYTFTITVNPDGEQLYKNQSGVRIPFVNGTLVILVISGVWIMIAMAAIYIVRVGNAGRVVEAAEASGEEGSMWISVVLATAAVITATGMVIVFVRAPVANTHITDPHNYTRTPIAYIDTAFPYIGFGLADESAADSGDPVSDGSLLYFKYGCSACHGLRGQGAVVGPALVDEIGSFGGFSEDVREGPKGMPAYDDASISEDNLQKIHTYLKEEEG